MKQVLELEKQVKIISLSRPWLQTVKWSIVLADSYN